MKALKLIFAFTAPALVAGTIGAALYAISANYNGIFTHDVLEAHTHAALIPFITLLSVALGYIPAFYYFINLFFAAAPLTVEEQASAADTLETPAPAALQIGQVIHTAGAQFRVKALKNTTFAAADLTQYEYLLNFSL